MVDGSEECAHRSAEERAGRCRAMWVRLLGAQTAARSEVRVDLYLASQGALPTGKVTLVAEVACQDAKDERGRPAQVTLTANGQQVGQGRLPRTVPLQLSLGEGVDVGMDTGSAVDFTRALPQSSRARSRESTSTWNGRAHAPARELDREEGAGGGFRRSRSPRCWGARYMPRNCVLMPNRIWSSGWPSPSCSTVNWGSMKTLKTVRPALTTLPSPAPIGTE
jgi:hypothetical protein